MKSSRRLAWSPKDFRVKFTVSKQDGFYIQIYLLLLCSKIFCKHLSPPSKHAIFIILTSPPQQSCLPRRRATESTAGGTHGLAQASTTVNWDHRDTGHLRLPTAFRWWHSDRRGRAIRPIKVSFSSLKTHYEQSPQLHIHTFQFLTTSHCFITILNSITLQIKNPEI